MSLVPSTVEAATSHHPAARASQQKSHHPSQSSVHTKRVPRVIRIAQGDTLWSLARRSGVSVQRLEQWNHLTDQSTLQIGQKVIYGWSTSRVSTTHPSIKQSSSSVSSQASPRWVTVAAGDTLWSLASQSGASLSELEQWNHLTDQSTLQIGQKLICGWSSTGVRRAAPLSARSESVTSPNLGSALFGEQVVQYGQQFLGTPYVWGGTTPSGFDCSGFVKYAYAHFGISLGRTSYDQFNEGQYISRSDLLPGDLVFFDTYGPGASHVGIYVGADRFIHAANEGVREDSLDESYWAVHYVGARRLK